MITPSSIEYISQVLNEPHAITDEDKESIQTLVNTYPYFVPGRYMQAAQRHKQKPYEPFMMATMQLYDGNWLLLHDFLRRSLGDADVETIYEAHPVEEVHIEEPAQFEEEHAISAHEDIYTINDKPETIQEFETVIEEPALPPQEDARNKEFTFEQLPYKEELKAEENDETLILPVYTEDYFLHQGVQVSNKIPAEVDQVGLDDEDKSLMVVMSFTEWLNHFKVRNQRAREEENDQRALKTMWQKEKLVAALEEENEEIPENVFEMAVNSIAWEDDLASESLAEIYAKQGKYDISLDMYRKLSLRNPQKSAYFARKIDAILKEKTT